MHVTSLSIASVMFVFTAHIMISRFADQQINFFSYVHIWATHTQCSVDFLPPVPIQPVNLCAVKTQGTSFLVTLPMIRL